MTDFTRAKWIEDGSRALEIQNDHHGRARFVVHQRHVDSQLQPCWAPIHTSGLYADAGSAESDGLQQWETLQKARFGGMTVNERLADAGLMREWDEALHLRDRDRMISILSAVELESQAARIADALLVQ
jgi:recombinational DNA repair protein (RecF pathway)